MCALVCVGQTAGGGDGHKEEGPLDTPLLHIILWSVIVYVHPHMHDSGSGDTSRY